MSKRRGGRRHEIDMSRKFEINKKKRTQQEINRSDWNLENASGERSPNNVRRKKIYIRRESSLKKGDIPETMRRLGKGLIKTGSKVGNGLSFYRAKTS